MTMATKAHALLSFGYLGGKQVQGVPMPIGAAAELARALACQHIGATYADPSWLVVSRKCTAVGVEGNGYFVGVQWVGPNCAGPAIRHIEE